MTSGRGRLSHFGKRWLREQEVREVQRDSERLREAWGEVLAENRRLRREQDTLLQRLKAAEALTSRCVAWLLVSAGGAGVALGVTAALLASAQ